MSHSHSFILRHLAIALSLSFFPLSGFAQAQIKVLKSFPQSALDGANPSGGGVVIGNKYFGTTALGGSKGKGVLYSINLDGTGFTKLKEFSETEGQPNQNGDSFGGLLTAGGQIYGTLRISNSSSSRIYRIDATGAGFVEIYSFDYSDSGSDPALTFVDGNVMYGFCRWGGTSGDGTIFRINLDGSGFQKLYDFQGGSDGADPVDIVDGGSAIYGITESGGIADKGSVFKINKDGTGYAQIKFITGETELRSIALSGGIIYVCSRMGGQTSQEVEDPTGFIFSIRPDGGNYTILKTFDYSTTGITFPEDIKISNNSIYGVAEYGNLSDKEERDNLEGGIFKMTLNGSGFTRLAPFSRLNNGATGKFPSRFIIHNGVLYGTNEEGGSGGVGTLYSLSLGGGGGNPPPLPTTQAMYGNVTITATTFSPTLRPRTTRTSGNTVNVTDSYQMTTATISNAIVLSAAVSAGLIPESKGYSIVCPDDFENGLEFFAYRQGFPLVSLAPIISFSEAANVQASSTVTSTNLSTGAVNVNVSGTEKSYATGTFLGMDVAVNRSITFKSGTVRLNGTTFSYFPSTTSATFFGGASDGTRFIEGRFSIASSRAIQVPAP